MLALKNLKFGQKIGGGYAIILILMVAISSVVYINVQQLIKISGWVNHTYNVLNVTQDLRASMVDMETGQRGFLVTGEDNYLEPFHTGKENFIRLVKEGSELTSDNASQTPRWKEVRLLKEKWLETVAEKEIEARREVQKGADAVKVFQQVSSRTVGKKIFDSMRETLSNLESEFSRGSLGQQLIVLITLDLVNMETGQRGFLLTGKEESLEPWVGGEQSFKQHLLDLKSIPGLSSQIKANVDKLQSQLKDWKEKAALLEINARRDINKFKLTIEDISEMMSSGDGKLIMDTIRSKLDEIKHAEEVLLDVRAQEQADESSFLITFTFVGTIVAIIAGCIVSVSVTRGVVGPTKEMSHMLEKISNGDLTQRIPVNSKDEIGLMATNLNAFTQSLEDSIRQVASYTELLATAAEELSAITSQTSEGVEHQKMSTELVAASINEMSSTVQEIAKNATDASDSANEADNEARNGNRVVQSAILSINQLANEIEASSDAIDTLKENSVNIGSVLNVIMGIAEQTNLLALNAAIEAARAGEQGRGFAVVADEVRALAQRTQESTSQIETLIESLRSGAANSVDVMERSRHKAQDTVDQATKAGQSLDSIMRSVEKIQQMNISIATATEEQSAVSEEINKSIHEIQTISENNSDGADQTSTASHELSKLGSQLQSIVSRFKIS